jgi:cell wall-associated NlpC family hydrolase
MSMRAAVLVSLAVLALLPLDPQPADASAALGLRAVAIAKAQKGKPYRYGASGPRAFDCSGLTTYVYRKRLHRKLPRTSSAQYRWAKRISRASARPGDLVFFASRGRVYHVGIYAGRNRMWHASRPGQPVKLARIWTKPYAFGRVR